MHLPTLTESIQNNNESSVINIPISEINPNRYQPRENFDDSGLDSLAKSISHLGIIQPLTVRRLGCGYELICGERRLRAAQLAGMTTVPCVLADYSDSLSAAAALVENLQRRDLNCFEQAEGLERLISEFGMTQQHIAVLLGISQPAVANKLRLLKLSEECKDQIIKSGLSERHSRALLKADESRRIEIIHTIKEKNMTAEQTEKYIDELNESEKRKRSYKRRAAALGDVRLFINTVEKAVGIMRLAGVNAETEKKQEEGYIEYVIKIPNRKKP